MPNAMLPLGLCTFCTPDSACIITENEHALVVRDGYPISPDHTLVIARLHVSSLFELRPQAQAAAWKMVAQVRTQLQQTYGGVPARLA
jgi:diadenosine tetraphosphate (Ap4A) HIT family hydrolase